MSDSEDKRRSPSGYEPASSPYDQPTERLGHDTSSLPRTDDDLDGSSRSGADRTGATEKIPTYPGPASASSPSPSLDDTATRAYPVADATPSSYGAAGTASSYETTATPEPVAAPTDVKERRGTLDLGLLILRVSVGAIVLVHGLQKLVGWFDGPGLSGFQDIVSGAGYEQARLLSVLGAVGETAGGALLVLGLATPLAGAAVLAVMINAWLVRQVAEPGLQFFAPTGVEYESLLALAAAAIVLTGPGRIAIDGTRGWARRPFIGSFVALLIGVGGAVALWILLNGADPFA
ncbi:DoxX family protein [Rhodococcoides corynebacterioides]|uniref:DoxX family protein n=1 Tax=Rhodococcoides corynebacterioides TaxID=53972 RepID=A0ABS7P349_9NOCA|nr:DoxX family protein [Rhodococcus corynebacterioides]MBY6366793.1 DoxX family protein [Rhodococcus corynebacterioides]MBY6408447.1 DoxX family protein [Rhodococcus corynebacterioides]